MSLFKRENKGTAHGGPTRASADIRRGYTLAVVSAATFFASRQENLYTAEELAALKDAREKTRSFREQINKHLQNDSLKTAHRAAQAAYDKNPSQANFEALRNATLPHDSETLQQIARLRDNVKQKIREVARNIAPTVRAVLERAAELVDKEILVARSAEEILCQQYGLAYETGVPVGALQNLLRRLDRAIAAKGDGPEIEELRGIVGELFANEPAPVAVAAPAQPEPEKPKRGRRSPQEPPSPFNHAVAENPVVIQDGPRTDGVLPEH